MLAVASATYGAYLIVSARGDRAWPTVEGKTLSSRFTAIVSPVPPSKAGVGSGTFIAGRWRVTYEYDVAGQRHRGEVSTSQPPSSSLRVYYHPMDPDISVLDPGVDLLFVVYSFVFSGGFYLASRFSYGAAGV
jgi:hypothetical protein